MHKLLLYALVCIWSICTYSQKTCEWNHVGNSLSAASTSQVQMHCTPLAQCQGVSCEGFVQQFSSVRHVTFCTDFVSDMCRSEPAVSLHITIPQLSLNTTKSLRHDDSLQLTRSSLAGVSITWFLHVTLERTNRSGVVLFGAQLRGSVKALGLSFFPSRMRLTLVPRQQIPAPPCDASQLPTAPATCTVSNHSWSSVTTAPHGFGSSCDVTSLASVCPPGQACVSAGAQAYCGCVRGLRWNAQHNRCEGVKGRTESVSAATPTASSVGSNKSGKHTALIAGCTGGAVALLIIAAVAVVFIRRRRSTADGFLPLPVPEPDDEPMLL